MLDLVSVARVNAALRRAFLAFVAAMLLTTHAPRAASAEPSAAVQSKAAEHYDRGVDLYERAQYAAAVKEFLAADELIPSSDALRSAIAAARRSNDHLLVLRAAQRAITRENADPKLAAGARAALAEASRHLARIETSCEPTPCALELDGAPIQPGVHYAIPGTHTIVAKGEAGVPDEERLAMVAGASYRIALKLKSAGVAPPAASTPPGAPATAKPPPTTPNADKPPKARPDESPSDRPLPPVAFYVGAGVTVVLIGVTTWSGLDTLSARDDLPERPTIDQIDDVEGRITRTDVLLATTTLVGAATAYAGIALVNWSHGGSARAGIVSTASGFRAGVTGRF